MILIKIYLIIKKNIRVSKEKSFNLSWILNIYFQIPSKQKYSRQLVGNFYIYEKENDYIINTCEINAILDLSFLIIVHFERLQQGKSCHEEVATAN